MERNWTDLVDSKIVPKIAHLDLSGKLTQITDFSPGGTYGDICKGCCSIDERGVVKVVKVAIKRLRYYMTGDNVKHLFEKEIYAWKRLKHDNILQLLGFAFDHEYPLLVSEWMEYGSARKYIEDHQDTNVIHLVVGIARGLAHMHAQNVIHADLKPDNVVISSMGEALICDFGCSRAIDASLSLAEPTLGLKGTCRYFAYELLQPDSKGHTKQTDVWAFGVTAYELLARQHAYKGLTYLQTVMAIQQGCLPCSSSRPNPFPNINQEIGNLVMDVCLFCWKHDPLERPTMSFLTSNLDHYLLMQEKHSSRQRLTEADESAFHDLSEKVVSVEREKREQDNAFNKEREEYKAEITRLKLELQKSSGLVDQERERAEILAQEVHTLKTQNEPETTVRRILEQRNSELLADVEALQRVQAEAFTEAINRTHAVQTLKRELLHIRDEHEEAKKLEATHTKKIERLLSAQTEALQGLAEARERGEDLHAQIEAARSENATANRELRELNEQKERLLRAQTLEHDRIMRDCIAEADGDRATLEHRLIEAQAQRERHERQLKEAYARIELLHADAVGLREELQKTDHELQVARHTGQVGRNDSCESRASQSDCEQKAADRDRLVVQILDVAVAFRDCHTNAFATLQSLPVFPAAVTQSDTNLSEPVVPSPPQSSTSPLCEDAVQIDPKDPIAALEILRSHDLELFSETVAKVGSILRKWQKQCKAYRERAKGKIAFRNFAKGDLALFLPTRDSVSRSWAAFNVWFPHHFLNVDGRLAEHLKHREWLVARITSISERIADAKDPTGNPYGLGDGMKYHVLEVEEAFR